jgi:hypothetical protein
VALCTRVGGSDAGHVLLVASHDGPLEADRERLIIDSYKEALFLGKASVSRIVRAILDMAKRKDLLERRMSWAQQQVYNWVQRVSCRPNAILPWGAFQALFPWLREQELRESCEWLARNGVLCYFPELDCVCTNVTWLAQLFSRVVSGASKSRGVVTVVGLMRAWSAEEPVVAKAVDVLLKFSVLVKSGGTHGYIVPWLVEGRPSLTPTQTLSRSQLHERVYRFERSAPKIILARMVSQHLQSLCWIWSEGAVLAFPGGKAELSFLPGSSTDVVLTSGQLSVLETTDAALREWAEEVFVVCPHCLELERTVEECQLLQLGRRESLTVFSCGEAMELSASSTLVPAGGLHNEQTALAPVISPALVIFEDDPEELRLQHLCVPVACKRVSVRFIGLLNTIAQNLTAPHNCLVQLLGVAFEPGLLLVLDEQPDTLSLEDALAIGKVFCRCFLF